MERGNLSLRCEGSESSGRSPLAHQECSGPFRTRSKRFASTAINDLGSTGPSYAQIYRCESAMDTLARVRLGITILLSLA
jgi:hypothetical protein